MNPDEFIKKTNLLIPSIYSMIEKGNLISFSNEVINSTRILNKKEVYPPFTKENPIEYLYSNYLIDNKKIICHLLNFANFPDKLTNNSTHFMSMETDFIVEDNMDGKIYVLDSYSWEYSYYCADNIYFFFDALIPTIELFWKQILGDVIEDDEKNKISNICANKASENKSSNCLSFYKVLNG